MNSRTLKPMSHQIGDEGDRRHEQRNRAEDRDVLAAVEGRDGVLRDAEILVEHPAPDAEDDRHRQDVGQEERRENDALQPALQPVDAERDDEPQQRARDD